MPKTLAPEFKAAERKKREEIDTNAIRQHKIGTPVRAHVFDLAGEKQKIEDDEAD